jgi:hypothetical protein
VDERHAMRDLAANCVTHLNRRLLRESWLIAVQPISFMSSSNSSSHQAERLLDTAKPLARYSAIWGRASDRLCYRH